MKLPRLAEVRKALVPVATLAGEALNLGLVPEKYQAYVTLGLSVLTVIGVHQVPNADKLPTAPVEPVIGDDSTHIPVA